MSLSKKTPTAVTTEEPSPLVKKYGSYIAGRESDANLINYSPTYGNPNNTTFKDTFTKLGQQYGFSPQLLFANANEEGLRDIIKQQGWSGNKDYQIPGAEYFGMDYFGGDYQNLVNGGLLPADFKQNFTPRTYTLPASEGGGQRPSADFKTFDSALTAQAAMLANRRQGVDKQAEKLGITLTPEARDFFTLVNYNASTNTMPQMMSDYSKAGYLDNNSFLKERPVVGKNGVKLSDKSYADVYDHTMRRMVPAQAWGEYFSTPTETKQSSSTAATLPDVFKATVNGKEVEVTKEKSGRYTYVDDSGEIQTYKSSK